MTLQTQLVIQSGSPGDRESAAGTQMAGNAEFWPQDLQRTAIDSQVGGALLCGRQWGGGLGWPRDDM